VERNNRIGYEINRAEAPKGGARGGGAGWGGENEEKPISRRNSPGQKSGRAAREGNKRKKSFTTHSVTKGMDEGKRCKGRHESLMTDVEVTKGGGS